MNIQKHTYKKVFKAILNPCLFRIVYLITLSFEMIAFADIIALPIRCLVLSWGAVILIYNFFVVPRAFKLKHRYLLWGFIFIGIITSLVNMSVDFLPNLVFVYHTIICFFIFYAMYTERSHKRLEKEMIFLLTYFVLFATLFALIAMVIVLFHAQLNIGTYYLGIFRNRLIGVYTNSNLLAFSMVVSIISCDIINDGYVLKRYKKMCIPRGIILFCIPVNFLALFLSDSNASFMFIVVYFTVRIFYKSFSNYNEFKIYNIVNGSLMLIVCCTVMMSVSFILRNACQNALGMLINDVHKIEEPVTDDVPEISSGQPPIESYMPEVKIGRENYDVSSGRIILLKQGINLCKVNPLIGIGRGNLVGYGQKHIEGGLIFSDLHNSYLTILVSYGIIGFLIFIIFSIIIAVDMCQYLFRGRYRNDSGIFSKLFSFLVAYCAYSLFEKAILSEITFMVVFFWIVLGYSVSYMNNGNRHKKLYLRELYGDTLDI